MSIDDETNSNTSPESNASSEQRTMTQPSIDPANAIPDMSVLGMPIAVDPAHLRLLIADLKLLRSDEDAVSKTCAELTRIAEMFETATVLRSKQVAKQGAPTRESMSRSIQRALERAGLNITVVDASGGRECECPDCVAARAAAAAEVPKTPEDKHSFN